MDCVVMINHQINIWKSQSIINAITNVLYPFHQVKQITKQTRPTATTAKGRNQTIQQLLNYLTIDLTITMIISCILVMFHGYFYF